MRQAARAAGFLVAIIVLVSTHLGGVLRAGADPGAGKPVLQMREWRVGGVIRQALIYAPAGAVTAQTPVVFAFHGHGGTARYAAANFDFQDVWPGAIAVYMQGLPTSSFFDPGGTGTGWQGNPGEQGDRDLKFFDAVLASLHKEYRIDDRRVYATGHSNGGWFTYVLWAARGDVFAAVAPSSAVAGRNLPRLKPKPALHVVGTDDPLVPFRFQMRTMTAVRALNGCDMVGRAWAKDCTLYPSKTGTPFVALVHPGGHTFPAEAPALIAKFFQENAKK